MAMTKCKECGQEVSTKAKKCPSCGVDNPGVTAKDQLIGVVILFVIIGAVVTMCSSGDDDAPEAAAPPRVDDATCMKDLQCWGDRHTGAAGVYCDDKVESLASYSARWTDGMLEPKFSHFRWLNKDQGTLTFIGDKIELQNGFGAWQNHIYECDYNPATKQVMDVRARPGRL